MKPRKNYRSRPKKNGAKKNQRILSQKRRLIAAGYTKEKLDKLTVVDIRDLLKEVMKKKGTKTKTAEKKKTTKKVVKKTTSTTKTAKATKSN